MIFGKVFLGGSKRIGRLPDKVVSMLDSFIKSGEHFLIGDCHGADLALQNYLHSKNYEKVTVFCSGEKCRFNVGGWEVRHIEASEELDGIEFYRERQGNDCRMRLRFLCVGYAFSWHQAEPHGSQTPRQADFYIQINNR